MKRLLPALLLAATLPSLAPAGTAPNPYDNSRSALGMNLIWVTEWESMLPFIDTFKKSRPWTATTGTLDLDPDGWVRSLAPGQYALTALMSPNTATQQALTHKFPSGDYVVTYTGNGTLAFLGSAVTQVQTPAPGRRIVSLDFSQPTASFSIRIEATDSANYLRNIHVYLPGGVCDHDPFHYAASAADCAPGAYESNETVADEFLFYAPFLHSLRHYRVIRYLQALGVNGSAISQPAEWRTLSAATWWGQLPIEVVARLANQLHADVWLNLPTRASDALVLHLAQRLHADLAPDLKVYTELSNEVWNGAFPYSQHAQWLASAGCARYPDLLQCDNDATPGNGVLCEGYPFPNQIADCTTARNRYFSDRTVEIGALFGTLFPRERLVRVMGAWNQLAYNRALLEYHNNAQGVDALAVTSYFGGYIPSNLNNPQILQSWLDEGGQTLALQRLFAELTTGNVLRPYYLPGGLYYDPARPAWQIPPETGAIDALLSQLASNIALAQEFNVAPISYEGGQHLDVTVNGNATGIRDLMLAANRDPRMGSAYARYLDGWRNLGGQMLMLYASHSSSSGFGMLEYELQPLSDQPKLAAVHQWIEQYPCWWAGCAASLLHADGFE
ncbi:MAG: hypothetical protein U1F26_01930 [Lysobacterales bacterium]